MWDMFAEQNARESYKKIRTSVLVVCRNKQKVRQSPSVVVSKKKRQEKKHSPNFSVQKKISHSIISRAKSLYRHKQHQCSY